MHASAGYAFKLQANDFQYIELRMKTNAGRGAEFFWANTTEGKDAGFVAGKERGFSCLADNEWHVYHVYPLWQGEVSRLRLDPPEGEGTEVAIDYIRIVQGAQSAHDPASPTWNLKHDGGGWVAVAGGTHLAPSDQGTGTRLTAETMTLISPRVTLQSAGYRYASIELSASEALQASFGWSDTDDGNVPGCNAIDFAVPAGACAVNLPLAPVSTFAGDLRRLQLVLRGKVGTQVVLQRVALSERPLGPAHLQLVAFEPDRALVIVGEERQIVATICNAGGEALPRATFHLGGDAGFVSVQGSRLQVVRDIAPGQTVRLVWRFVVHAAGNTSFTIAGPDGLRGARKLVASTPFPRPVFGAIPSAGVGPAAAWIGNDRVALTLTRGAGGFSQGRLEAVAGKTMRPMAVLPHLASLATAAAPEPVDLVAQQAVVVEGEQAVTLKLRGTAPIGPARVRLDIAFTAHAGKSYLDAEYSLSADRDLRITAFRGPWLWAGEGAFGARQDLALFPGVEYLETGEHSSSTLDIAAPANVRFAPHPNTITIPSMAVEHDGAIVGLMWDPRQQWDGEHCKPSAVFSSPNDVEGYANHLMGLYLPAIPEWVKPNELLAATPYELSAGRRLHLTAAMYAQTGADVLNAVEQYLDRFGLPALPPRPRSYEDTIALCLQAYENALWSEAAQGWMGVIGWAPGRDQTVAMDYYQLASRTLHDTAWAQRLAAKGRALSDRSTLSFALHAGGRPTEALASALARGQAAAQAAPADGKYTFQPTARTRSLGSEGTTASGICARAVRPLLADALLTGAPEPLAAALKTLKLMDGFRVPRASQVWEVPVHTPDVLAAADACDVYLTAYRLTRDPALLKRAVAWARRGLPFIYLWQAPEQRPLMKGGSIAVFGASFYTGSWFARPVQWNGLAYARALLELAPFDSSLPWKHFAEMITISAMNQQSTRDKDRGTYTDNWDVIRDIECVGCMLSPSGILSNTLRILGLPVGVSTEVVRDHDKPMCINSGGSISGARIQKGILQFALRYDPGYTASTTLMPIAEPTRVEVDGVELPARADPIAAPEGWSYQRELGCVTLKLAFGTSPRQVRVVKADPIVPRLPTPRWEFLAGDTAGWTAANDVAPLAVRDGNLVVHVTGPDPYIHSPAVALDAARHPGVVLCASATRPGGQLFFATERGGFSQEQSRSFDLPADGAFHEVKLDLSDHKAWTGSVRQLRLDFAAAPCEVRLQWVRVLAAPAKPVPTPPAAKPPTPAPPKPVAPTPAPATTGPERVGGDGNA